LDRHGDIVYVTYTEPPMDTESKQPPASDANGSIAFDKLSHIEQDPVNDFLEKQRGLIKRPKDPKL
jgi:nuclear protein localization family protein 4